MLSTIELEKYIKREITNKLNDVNWEKINFREGNENSTEGTYIFSGDDGYHILFTEKGKVREDKIMIEKKEVLWCVVNIFSFDIAMEYAMSNREKERDFRYGLFSKEIEICLLFGEEFEKRKKFEIEEILNKNPYNN